MSHASEAPRPGDERSEGRGGESAAPESESAVTYGRRKTDYGRREEELLAAAVARMRAGVMATVFALVGAAVLLLATAWLLVRGGPNVGQHLGLLRHYFPGYTVTWPGAFLGGLYGALVGGIVGWTLAHLYNLVADRRDGTPTSG